MGRKTKLYNLDYIAQGGLVGETAESRRMETIDRHIYNVAESVGSGILSGWRIEVVSGTTVRLTPGTGIIQNKYSETAWYIDPSLLTPKKKSEAISNGDIVIKEIPTWSPKDASNWEGAFFRTSGSEDSEARVLKQFGPEGEDYDQDGTNDLLYPRFEDAPESMFDDPYVKAVELGSITLTLVDDADNYIFVSRVSDQPFDTFVNITSSTSNLAGDTNLLVAKVLVRGGVVTSVDYSQTKQLKNFEGTIAKGATNLLKSHRHNGADGNPEQIRLESDVRSAKLYLYNPNSGTSVFKILSNKYTSIDKGHKHLYFVDRLGDGYTQSLSGDVNFHYHEIKNFKISSTISQPDIEITPHTHIINENNDTLQPDSNIRVLSDGVEIEDYVIDYEEQTITFENGGIDVRLPSYSMSVPLGKEGVFEYQEEGTTLFLFILRAMIKFREENAPKLPTFDEFGGLSNSPTIRQDPFEFYTSSFLSPKNLELRLDGKYIFSDPILVSEVPTGPSASQYFGILPYIKPLKEQVAMALSVLNNRGDTFVLLPYVARFATITLAEVANTPDIKIEIFDDVEVTGIIPKENIPFVNSKKIASGEFSIGHVPNIDHEGRIYEEFVPRKNKVITGDTYNYSLVPSVTDLEFGHEHTISIDEDGNGSTTATTISDEIAVYVEDETDIYLINHFHRVSDFIVSEEINPETNRWQEADTNASHSHKIIKPVMGDFKSIYDYLKDDVGNELFVTSDGIYVRPVDSILNVNIDGYQYGIISKKTDFEDAFQKISNRHWLEVGNLIDISNIDLSDLTSTLDSRFYAAKVILVGNHSLNERKENEVVSIRISVIKESKIHNFKTESYKLFQDLLPEDEVLKIFEVDKSLLSGVDVKNASLATMASVINSDPVSIASSTESTSAGPSDLIDTNFEGSGSVDVYRVRRDFSKEIFYQINLWNGVIYITGPKSYVHSLDLYKWNINNAPVNASIIKKTILLNENIFSITDNGVFYGKKLNNSNLSSVDVFTSKSDMSDAIKGGNSILICNEEGIFLSDNGFDYTASYEGNVRFLARNYLSDITNTHVDHYHYLNIDSRGNGYTTSAHASGGGAYAGADHIHEVLEYSIQPEGGHEHKVVSTLFALSYLNEILKSIDNGVSWIKTGDFTGLSYRAESFSHVINKLWITTEDGVFVSNDEGASWTRSFVENIYRVTHNEELNTAMFLGDNNIWESKNGILFEIYKEFSGSLKPTAFIDEASVGLGYYYSNGGKFCFKNSMANASIKISTNNSYLIAPNGPWDKDANYSIFINNKLIISTKDNIDIREIDNPFTVSAETGVVDFTKSTKLSSDLNLGQNFIFVMDPVGISVGDFISISFIDKIRTGVDSSGEPIYKKRLSGFKSKVLSVSGNKISINDHSTKTIPSLSGVTIVSSNTFETSVRASIFDSIIDDKGIYTHAEIEDSIGNETSRMPFEASNLYLDNIGNLTASLLASDDTVDDYFNNWNAYMMRFNNSDPLNANYIEKFFDTEESNIQSGISYESTFDLTTSKAINTVREGEGTYSGILFAGTDKGLFSSKLVENRESQWFLIPSPLTAVKSILFFKEAVLITGPEGMYQSLSNKLTRWKKVGSSIFDGAVDFAGWRFTSHSAAGEYWWNSWDGGINLIDTDLTNTLIAGADNIIGYSNDQSNTWGSSQTQINGLSAFSPSGIYTTRSGKCLLSINYATFDDMTGSAILSTSGFGNYWDKREAYFKSYSGSITKKTLNASNNTAVEIDLDKFIPTNQLAGKQFTHNGKSYFVINNYEKSVTLFGSDPYVWLDEEELITIPSVKINNIIETEDNQIWLGTDVGLLTDSGTNQSTEKRDGAISKIFHRATVEGIDIQGEILEENSVGENTKIRCQLNRDVLKNQLIGKKVIVKSNNSPSISVLSPLAGSTVGKNVTVTTSVISFDIDNGYVAISMEGRDTVYTKNNSYLFEDLAIGLHSIQVFLVDNSFNKLSDSNTVNISFTSDYEDENSQITINSPVNGATITSSTANISVSISNFNVGLQGLAFYIIGNQSPISIPGSSFIGDTATFTVNGLSDGTNSIEIYLTDLSENKIGISSTSFFTVSTTTLPVITISSPVDNQTFLTEDVTFSYNVENITVPGSGSVRVSIGSTVYPLSTSNNSYTVSGLENGSYTATLQLVDVNEDSFSNDESFSEVNFTVDTSNVEAPAISILNPVSGSEIASGGSSSINYVVSNFEIPLEGGVIAEISIDGNSSKTFHENESSISFNIDIEGTYEITLTLGDSINSPISGNFTSDTIEFEVTATPKAMFLSENIVEQNVPRSEPQEVEVRDFIPRAENSVETKASFTILSNTASGTNGLSEITVQGSLTGFENSEIHIVGSSSTIYLKFDQPAEVGDFTGGTVFVGPNQFNTGKEYSISYQGNDYVIIDSIIDPTAEPENASEKDVSVGQSVVFVPASGLATIWTMFDSGGVNNLVGEKIILETLEGESAGNEYEIISNTPSQIVISPAPDISRVIAGNSFEISTLKFNPLNTFYGQYGSLELDHVHTLELINKMLKGRIESFTFLDENTVEIMVSDTADLSHPAISTSADLLDEATVYFYDPSDLKAEYTATVKEVYSDRIIASVKDQSNWNISATDRSKISENYEWAIDATGYGQTTSAEFIDFRIINTTATSQIDAGDTSIEVDSTTGMLALDKIKIFNDNGVGEIHEISTVTDSENIAISEAISREYKLINNPRVAVLRSGALDNHVHLIKNLEIQNTSIDSYAELGYQRDHAHRAVGLLTSVVDLDLSYKNNKIFVVGGNNGISTNIYETEDNGATWGASFALEDEDNFDENSKVATSIDASRWGQMYVGVDSGYIVAQVEDLGTEPDLDYIFEDVFPSSSSESSQSSSSSSNSSSSSSSIVRKSSSSSSSSIITKSSSSSSSSSSSVITYSSSSSYSSNSSSSSSSSSSIITYSSSSSSSGQGGVGGSAIGINFIIG